MAQLTPSTIRRIMQGRVDISTLGPEFDSVLQALGKQRRNPVPVPVGPASAGRAAPTRVSPFVAANQQSATAVTTTLDRASPADQQRAAQAGAQGIRSINPRGDIADSAQRRGTQFASQRSGVSGNRRLRPFSPR